MVSEHRQNRVMETSISIKIDAECNETTPDIILYRLHEDCEIFTKWRQKVCLYHHKCSNYKKKYRYGINDIWNVSLFLCFDARICCLFVDNFQMSIVVLVCLCPLWCVHFCIYAKWKNVARMLFQYSWWRSMFTNN